MPDAHLASSIAARRGKRDVFCYFDNDIKVHAPYDAAGLAKRLGLATGLDTDGQFAPELDADNIELAEASWATG